MDITLSYWWGDPLNVSGKGRFQSELRSCVKVEVADFGSPSLRSLQT